MRSPGLIELDRRFVAVSKDESPWGEREERLRWLPTSGWAELLELPCAVVLGEAGAGKTAELRRATAVVNEKQRGIGFFLPVEAVALAGMDRVFTLAQREDFRRWRDTDAHGWFFLDSVDEAKLKQRSLALAIGALSHELESLLPRIHIIVSSRTSDWRSTDEAVLAPLRHYLAGGTTTKDDAPLMFELAPLDKPQIARLAEHHRLTGTDLAAFLAAAKDADAWSFLERPLDVLALVGYWKEHRRFGAHREVVSTSIDVKLAEDPERGSRLSPARARSGAQKLALAGVLSQNATFLLPGEEQDRRAGDALVPARILPDWSDADIKELLTRGLFDEATYGRVRIHHRQAQEYLAADELLRMVDAGWPKEDLESLLFRNSSGTVVTPAHLQAVVAWCSLRNRHVRRRALEIIPEHLLDRGDPSGLVPEDRRAALLAYVGRFGKQVRVFHGFDYFGLKRFACPELAGTILEVLRESATPEHLKSLLLEMVEHGEVAQCAQAALAIALDATATPYLRVAAIEAAARAGTDNDRVALLALVGTDAAKDRDVAAKLITLLYPQHMPDGTLVELAASVSHPQRNRTDRLEALLSGHLTSVTSVEQRRFLLTAFLGKLTRFDSSDGQGHIGRAQHWLVSSLAALLASLVGDEEVPSHARDEAISIVETCGDDHDFYSRRSLDVVEKDHGLRASMFWRRVHQQALKEGPFPRELWQLKLSRLLHLGPTDITWLNHACVEHPKLQERILALHAIVNLTAVKDDAFWLAMDTLATASDERHGGRAMRTRLARRKSWTPEPRYTQWQVEHRAFALRDHKIHLAWHERLRSKIELLRSGFDEKALDHFYRECPGDTSDRSERVSIAKIAEMYDADLAEAARLGFIAFWRRHAPARVEDYPANSAPWGSLWGLVGLALDVDAGTDLLQLPDVLFGRAVAYAPWELSTLPAWLEGCAKARPAIVAELFAPVLQIDFAAPNQAEENLGRLLYKLPHEPLAVRDACAPQLAELIQEGDPPRCSVLEYVLKALDGTTALTTSALLDLARARTADCERDTPRFSIWWREFVLQAPSEAVDYLADVAARHEAPEKLLEAILDDLGDQFDRRSGRGLEQLRRDPGALAKLSELVDTCVPRPIQVDDPEESAHWAGRELRSRLSTWLAALDDPRATKALRELAERDGIPIVERDWLRHLAEGRAVADVSKPMRSDQLVKFVTSSLIEPSTAAALFEIAKNRLRDVRYGLAHDDFSLRAAFNPKAESVLEEPVQNFLARELDDGRLGQYDVVREPEVARRKKPDIRLVNAHCAGPTTIEVKIAQRWTVEKLEDALSSQLVDQYMRSNRSNFGIYVICSSGPQGTWPTPEGTAIDFNGLVSRLSALARRLLDQTPWIQGLEVVPIDFH